MRIGIWAIALALVVMVSTVMAAEVIATNNGADGQYTVTDSYGSTSADAGKIYDVDVTINDASDAWAGFYGEITGTIKIGDDSSHTFFQWTGMLPDYIYITYKNDIDWSTVTNTDASTFDSILQTEITGWSAGDEPVSETFDETDDCGTGTSTIAAKVYGDLDASGNPDYEWPVCAYKARDTTSSSGYNRAVYGATVVDNGTAYNDETADYEAIVAAGSSTTIYFYK